MFHYAAKYAKMCQRTHLRNESGKPCNASFPLILYRSYWSRESDLNCKAQPLRSRPTHYERVLGVFMGVGLRP